MRSLQLPALSFMLKKIALSFFLLVLTAAPGAVAAQVFDTGLDDAGKASYGPGAQTDLAVIIGTLINVLFSLIGVIFLILIIYAGFLWMTAAGNDGQVKTAKNIMTTSVVGLVILLSAYAIAEFIVGALGVATTGTGI